MTCRPHPLSYRPVGRRSLNPGDWLINTTDNARKFSRSAYKTRAQIIDAACQLIGESGYEALTAAALVEKAGISKGGLYHHFDRLTDVVIAAYEKTEFELFGSLAGCEPETLDEYLDAVETLIFDGLLRSPEKLRILYELQPKILFDPGFIANRRIGFDNGVSIMGQRLEAACGDDLDKEDVEATLRLISVFMRGLGTTVATLDGKDESRDLWRRFRHLISAQIGEKYRPAYVASR